MSSPSLDETTRPSDFYKQRAKELRLELEEVVKRQGSYRSGVILLGLFACVMLYQSVVAKRLPLWTSVLVVPFGLYLVRQSRNCQQRALNLLRLADYYDKGIARLAYEWESLDEGRDFIDQDHFYATDLDLFGRGSLFQVLCSARTQTGRETLANWMKKAASREEILARHAAISELRGRHDLREALNSTGTLEVSNCRPETFRAWVASSPSPFPSWGALLAPFLPLAALVLPILYGFGLIGLQVLWLGVTALVIVEMSFAGMFLRRVRAFSESTGPLSIELPIVSEILRIVAREHFSSATLVALVDRMRKGSSPIRRLQLLIKLHKERDNPYFTWVSYLLLWETQFAMAIDQWRHRYGAQLIDWLAALGELEALTSLSAYAYEHPLDLFPEVLAEGPAIDAEGLGHPLLNESTCVRNDFELGKNVQFLIVSGSNMSGKSTFLRAIGLNTVLAWMGAPVRCTRFRSSPLEVGAAVRVQDSVVDGRSHFLAEMQRLRRTIDVASETPLLYLADEIMSGTNSKDRRTATEWVVRALALRGAVGIITTHDLALTEIASNGLAGRNVHFEDTGEFGNLTFDYKLRPGVLTHSNALNIAHMLGIDAAAIGESTRNKHPSDHPISPPEPDQSR
jgi:MutS domain V